MFQAYNFGKKDTPHWHETLAHLDNRNNGRRLGLKHKIKQQYMFLVSYSSQVTPISMDWSAKGEREQFVQRHY